MENTQRLALTITEAARMVGVSRPTVYKWMGIEGFPVARIGGTVRIPVRAFERWLEVQAGISSGGGETG